MSIQVRLFLRVSRETTRLVDRGEQTILASGESRHVDVLSGECHQIDVVPSHRKTHPDDRRVPLTATVGRVDRLSRAAGELVGVVVEAESDLVGETCPVA